jgi:serine/threonine protein kinase
LYAELKVVDNPVWLAPEMMRKESYDEKVDVYSYGVILWELIARKDFLGHITFLSAIEGLHLFYVVICFPTISRP